MTIGEAISVIRMRLGNIVGYDPDNVLPDEALFKLISDAGAIVFSRYREKYFAISPWMYSTFGIKMQMVNSDMFPCEDIEHCALLESEHTIPEAIMSRNRPVIKVKVGDKEIEPWHQANYLDEYLKDQPSWEIVNSKLRIHNNTTLKGITIKTIPANITEWYDKKYCPDTETVECFNLDELEFPLMSDPKFSGMVYDMVINWIIFPNQEGNQNPAH